MSSAPTNLTITERDGVFFFAGTVDEYADFSSLMPVPAPLRLNMRSVTRLNSIGIRNLLKFLATRGPKELEYYDCPAVFIEQINMIPSLLGPQSSGKVVSFYLPFGCTRCSHEEDELVRADDYRAVAKAGPLPTRPCPRCGGVMNLLSDSFLAFLAR